MAMTGGPNDERERADIERMLPWYATGKLARRDRDRVAEALPRHPGLARALARADAERMACVHANEAIAGPGAASQARLMARARAAARFGVPRAVWRGIQDFFARPTAQATRRAAAVGGLLLLAEAAAIGLLLVRGGMLRREAASQSLRASADGVFALVRFAESSPFGVVAEALAELDATIVEGPKPGGFFKVRLGPGDMTEAARNKRIAALRRRRDAVKLVLPSAPRQRQ